MEICISIGLINKQNKVVGSCRITYRPECIAVVKPVIEPFCATDATCVQLGCFAEQVTRWFTSFDRSAESPAQRLTIAELLVWEGVVWIPAKLCGTVRYLTPGLDCNNLAL